MNEKIIVFIDDDFKQKQSDLIKFSEIINEAKTGCKVLDKKDIQELIKNLNNPSDNKETEFDSWLNKIHSEYEILAFVLDIELKTEPFNGISILNRIRKGDFLTATNKNQFFCEHIPILMLTGVDSKDNEYEDSSYKQKLPTHFFNKNTISYVKLQHTLEEEISKFYSLTKDKEIEKNVEEILNITKENSDILKQINVIVKMIAKSLPMLTDKTKAKQIIDNMNTDEEFKKFMQECSIVKPENLFTKLSYLKDKFTDSSKDNLAEMIYEEATQFFESEAKVDENDDRLTKFLKYSTYTVEKIGEVVYKR